LGIVGFLLGYASFLAFEVRHGFPNTMSVIRFILAGKDTGLSINFFQTIGDVTFRLFGRLVFRLPQPELWSSFPLWQRQVWEIGIIGSIILAVFILLRFIFYKRLVTLGDRQRASILFMFWLVVILVLFGFYKKAIYDYYFGIFFALPFLLIGLIVWRLSLVRFGKIVAGGIWIGLLYFNWQGRPFLYPPNNQLAQARRIAMTALEKTEGKPFNFALITGQNSDHVYRYFFEISGNAPVTIENEAKDPKRQTVTDQLIVICEYYECKPLGHSLWEIAGFGKAQIVGEWDVPFVKIIKLVHLSENKK